MSEPETLPSGVHPEAALLPWYASGTLPDAERRQVAQHVESCADCRRELEELTSMKRSLATWYESQPTPSPSLARSVMTQVAAERRGTSAQALNRNSWLDTLDGWLRAFFMPRWAPTLIATLLLLQVGLLMWARTSVPPSDPVTTRGLGMPSLRLSVAFQPTATEGDIRSALETVRGRIVDGPNMNGLYTIEVLAADADTGRNKLSLLRQNTRVVRAADLEKP